MVRVVAIETPDRVAPTVAQQIFTIGSAVAGGAAGLNLAKEFVGLRYVPTSLVVKATIISILFTLGAGIYLAKKAKEASTYGS